MPVSFPFPVLNSSYNCSKSFARASLYTKTSLLYNHNVRFTRALRRHPGHQGPPNNATASYIKSRKPQANGKMLQESWDMKEPISVSMTWNISARRQSWLFWISLQCERSGPVQKGDANFLGSMMRSRQMSPTLCRTSPSGMHTWITLETLTIQGRPTGSLVGFSEARLIVDSSPRDSNSAPHAIYASSNLCLNLLALCTKARKSCHRIFDQSTVMQCYTSNRIMTESLFLTVSFNRPEWFSWIRWEIVASWINSSTLEWYILATAFLSARNGSVERYRSECTGEYR